MDDRARGGRGGGGGRGVNAQGEGWSQQQEAILNVAAHERL
jgi:hypothetical protein